MPTPPRSGGGGGGRFQWQVYNLSQTRAIFMTACQRMTCFLLLDKLCDYTVQSFVVGSANSDDGT